MASPLKFVYISSTRCSLDIPYRRPPPDWFCIHDVTSYRYESSNTLPQDLRGSARRVRHPHSRPDNTTAVAALSYPLTLPLHLKTPRPGLIGSGLKSRIILSLFWSWRSSRRRVLVTRRKRRKPMWIPPYTSRSPTPDLWAQGSPPRSPCWTLNRKLAGDAKKSARALRVSLNYFSGLMFQSEMSEMILRIRLHSYQLAMPFSHPRELFLELSLLFL